MMLILVTLAAAVVTYLVKLYWSSRDFWKKIDTIPGETCYPLVGNALSVGTTPAEIHDSIFRMWNKFGRKTFKICFGYKPAVFVSTVDVLETILSSNTMLEKGFVYNHLWRWLGDGLLTSTGSKWHARRKMLTPAFHFKILEQFQMSFNREAAVFAKILEKHSGKTAFDVYPYTSLATLCAICDSAMGVQLNAQEEDSEYAETIKKLCELMHLRMFSIFKQFDFFFYKSSDGRKHNDYVERLHKFSKSVIEQRRKEMKSEIDSGYSSLDSVDDLGLRQRKALLDVLLLSKTNDGRRLNDDDIREEVDTFMFEGHDTTTSGIVYILYELANNQAIQDKVFYEILRIQGGSDDERDFSIKEINDMKYLDLFVKEVFRIHPPVPLIARTLDQDIRTEEGYILPKGAMAMMAPMLLHMNPDYFDEPERFYPERFLSENLKSSNPYSYIPFSAGARNCIGQKYAVLETKTMTCWILRKYRILSEPGFIPMRTSDITLKSENGIMIRLEKRK